MLTAWTDDELLSTLVKRDKSNPIAWENITISCILHEFHLCDLYGNVKFLEKTYINVVRRLCESVQMRLYKFIATNPPKCKIVMNCHECVCVCWKNCMHNYFKHCNSSDLSAPLSLSRNDSGNNFCLFYAWQNNHYVWYPPTNIMNLLMLICAVIGQITSICGYFLSETFW